MKISFSSILWLPLVATASAAEILEGVAIVNDGTAVRFSDLSLDSRSTEAGLAGDLHRLQFDYQIAMGKLHSEQLEKLGAILKRAEAAGDRNTITETLLAIRKTPGAPKFQASAVIEFAPLQSTEAEQLLRKVLPNDPFLLDLKRIPGTNRFELTVLSPEAKHAAERANELADILKTGMPLESRGTLPEVLIISRAERPARPLEAFARVVPVPATPPPAPKP